MRAPIANPWGSPRGLSVQTVDVYVDTDPRAEGGARLLLPGRNAALPAGHGWEYALTVEGWDSAFYVAGGGGALERAPAVVRPGGVSRRRQSDPHPGRGVAGGWRAGGDALRLPGRDRLDRRSDRRRLRPDPAAHPALSHGGVSGTNCRLSTDRCTRH